MKIYCIACLVLIGSLKVLSQNAPTIGMKMDQVEKIYPDMDSTRYKNSTTLTRSENLFGLDGQWGYRFEDQKLTWIYFHKYIDEINEQNFNKCLSATKQLIRGYTKLYGKPDSTITGKTKFIDPYKNIHYGYNVIEARWKNADQMKIKIGFNFMGGKGEYHFLVNINNFDSTYPYFD